VVIAARLMLGYASIQAFTREGMMTRSVRLLAAIAGLVCLSTGMSGHIVVAIGGGSYSGEYMAVTLPAR